MRKKRKIIIPSSLKIILSFLGVILVGTFILMLPISAKYPETGKTLSFIDALFMTTSAVCVTGLSVVSDVGSAFTIFGKIIMAILIEIGGLSFLTISIFLFIVLKRKIGLSERFLMKDALNQNSIGGVIRLVKHIVFISGVVQIIGVVVNMIVFSPYYSSFFTLFGVSVFHSISSFNNAGFDVFGQGNSMIPFQTDVWINIQTMYLITIGGIGFGVILEVLHILSWKENAFLPEVQMQGHYLRSNKELKNLWKERKGSFKLYFHKKRRLSHHFLIVTSMSLFLILLGFVVFYFAGHMTVLEAFFQSVTARTAGFATIDLGDPSAFNDASYLTMLFLMFVGASPSSTGGGVKTTTLFIILLAFVSYARGKKPKIGKRQVSEETVHKALVLVVFSILYITIMTILICIFEENNPGMNMKTILFEMVSAFGTVGVSMGITSKLIGISKFILCITMFLGRLGPLTFLGILAKNGITNKEEVRYVEETINIG